MTPYRQILRLHSQGISRRNFTASCACSRNTVAKVLESAAELGMTWPLENEQTDEELRQRFFAQRRPLPRPEGIRTMSIFIGKWPKAV